jgi:hypothetical protein
VKLPRKVPLLPESTISHHLIFGILLDERRLGVFDAVSIDVNGTRCLEAETMAAEMANRAQRIVSFML